MGIISKVQQEALEYIRLEHFLYVLNSSISGSGFNEFYLLPELLDKGLRLSYTESGYVFDEQMAFKGDVKYALKRLERKLFDTDEPKSKLYKDEVVKTQDGLEISLGNLLVKRSDVEKIYSEYGESQYPWALVLWPQSSDDWSWFPVDEKSECNEMPQAEAVANNQAGYITDWRLYKSLTIYEAAAFHHGMHPKFSCGPLQRALLSSTVQSLIRAVLTGAIRTLEPCNQDAEITHNTVIATEDVVSYFGNQTVQGIQSTTFPAKVVCNEASKSKVTGGKSDKDFDKRLAVLKAWLIKQNYYLSEDVTTLPKEYTHNTIHIALNNESSDKSLFDLTLGSFKRHFWQKQKIAKLKSGR